MDIGRRFRTFVTNPAFRAAWSEALACRPPPRRRDMLLASDPSTALQIRCRKMTYVRYFDIRARRRGGGVEARRGSAEEVLERHAFWRSAMSRGSSESESESDGESAKSTVSLRRLNSVEDTLITAGLWSWSSTIDRRRIALRVLPTVRIGDECHRCHRR